ncbi:MAG: hypothetical protein E7G42_01065 [Serratia marcescens]|nr:hypothetical protein [Serratia marcescens]MDU3817804.1 hypothetical protein [Pantoea sp.]
MNRRAFKFKQAFAVETVKLSEEFTGLEAVCDYPESKIYRYFDKHTRQYFAVINITDFIITVSLLDKKRAYTFGMATQNPLEDIEACDDEQSEIWEHNMLRHSNNGPVEECYYWDWHNFKEEIDLEVANWKCQVEAAADPEDKNNTAINAFSDAAAKAKDVIDVAPSLADVMIKYDGWVNSTFQLPETVPIDDYVVWDKQFIRALAMIYKLALNPPAKTPESVAAE